LKLDPYKGEIIEKIDKDVRLKRIAKDYEVNPNTLTKFIKRYNLRPSKKTKNK